jgi:hypothetical protein
VNPNVKPPDDPADREPSSPYGPQPYGDDEAAGGADSSPHETESTEERRDEQTPASEEQAG